MTVSDDDSGRRTLAAAFRMPSVQTMLSRKSSITNAFVNAIVPVIAPTPEEVGEALAILGLEPEDLRCAYCGDRATEWDHLRPLVLNRRPTGFASEIANLVPSCGKCNQSKGNKPWRDWMLGNARLSPTGRGIQDVAERVSRLQAYERWRPPVHVDFESVVGHDAWIGYWSMCEEVVAELAKCQQAAESLREQIAAKVRLK